MTTALLVTSNGVGMGHLSRQLSVALACGDDVRPVLFSLSVGLPQVLGRGVGGEYCPSYERDWMPRRSWHAYLRRRVVAIARELAVDVLVFDGVAPYRGLLAARSSLPGVSFVWMRRSMWGRHVGASRLRSAAAFDRVWEPGDLGSDQDRGVTAGRTDAEPIPPVSMLEVVPRLVRREAAERLGLDADRPALLVTLGSGRLGDPVSPAQVVLDEMAGHPEWQVAITRSAIATSGVPVGDRDRVVELRDVFPLVEYLQAFDAAVGAAGYNAVHELVSGGLPTLLVPNEVTRTDDQLARARGVERRGLALAARESDPSNIVRHLGRLRDPTTRREITEAISALAPDDRMGGARTAATRLAAPGDGTSRRRLRGWGARVEDAARAAVMAALAASGTGFGRRVVQRPGPNVLLAPMTVMPTDLAEATGPPTPLIVTESLDMELMASGRPIEHLLAGSSEEYRARRKEIVRAHYRVQDPGYRTQ